MILSLGSLCKRQRAILFFFFFFLIKRLLVNNQRRCKCAMIKRRSIDKHQRENVSYTLFALFVAGCRMGRSDKV